MSVGVAEISTLSRRCLFLGALLMAIGVMLGAFGAHGLRTVLTAKQLASYETAVLYHLLHAFGLLLVGIVARVTAESGPLRWSARLMLAGVVFFSGSIYLMTAGAPRWLGMVAPVGGMAFMAAWGLLAWHARGALPGSRRG